MKVAPYLKRWNEGERDWSFVKDPRKDVELWEDRERITLPSDYRTFLLRFNGGCVYPRLFKHNIPDSEVPNESIESIVDPIYDWKTVEGHWEGTTYGRQSVPPEHLIIAGTPGSIEILISLRGPTAGKIYTWVHSNHIWNTDRNIKIHAQAENFYEFLGSLFDDDERTDYDAWHLPIYDKLAKDWDNKS